MYVLLSQGRVLKKCNSFAQITIRKANQIPPLICHSILSFGTSVFAAFGRWTLVRVGPVRGLGPLNNVFVYTGFNAFDT